MVQSESEQARTVPLTVAVKFNVTVIVWMLTTTPVLSVAVSLKLPVAVPADRVALLAVTVNKVPLPVSG